MSSLKLERIKQRYPQLAPLLDRLIGYVRAQSADAQEYIVPKLAAADLHLSDGEAFVLLQVLADGGLFRRVYNVYCRKENALLATVQSLDALDELSPHCDFCDVDHDPLDLKVEIAFRLENEGSKDLAA
jgi:hypothetical protein